MFSRHIAKQRNNPKPTFDSFLQHVMVHSLTGFNPCRANILLTMRKIIQIPPSRNKERSTIVIIVISHKARQNHGFQWFEPFMLTFIHCKIIQSSFNHYKVELFLPTPFTGHGLATGNKFWWTPKYQTNNYTNFHNFNTRILFKDPKFKLK